MKILLVNKFFYPKGGAEVSFFETAKLLANKGHKVIFFSMKHPRNLSSEFEKYFISNIDYEKSGFINKINTSLKLLYSFEARRRIEDLIKNEKPDIAHINNIYHQISPSILHSLKKFDIPIVMSLRDYKMVCASYRLLCDGKVCEGCKNGRYYYCFLKGCMKDSKMKSLLNVVEMYLHHKILHIYDLVDAFISPSKFLKDKLKEMGFKKKIIYLPNFIKLEEFNPQYNWDEDSIVYFGRLSKEKGLFTLLEAVKGLDIKVKIIGEGSIKRDLDFRSKVVDCRVEFLGYKSGEELKDEIRKSMFVVLPSEYYENNPRSVIEGFALGKPAVASKIGGIPELIKDNETGLTFKAGDIEDLRAKLKLLLSNRAEISRMGRNARKLVEDKFTQELHYRKLIEIYKSVME